MDLYHAYILHENNRTKVSCVQTVFTFVIAAQHVTHPTTIQFYRGITDALCVLCVNKKTILSARLQIRQSKLGYRFDKTPIWDSGCNLSEKQADRSTCANHDDYILIYTNTTDNRTNHLRLMY